MRNTETYLQTQVNLMTSDQVLNRAVASESVNDLPMIKDSEDPKTNLREKIVVEIEPGTYMIRVGLESKDPNEAAAIVNAVVESYLDENLRYTRNQGQDTESQLDRTTRQPEGTNRKEEDRPARIASERQCADL